MKKVVASVLVLALTLCMFTGCGSSKKQEAIEKYGSDVLKLYNWGEYIDPVVLEMFTEETGIEVIYDEYETNEVMYPKVASGATQYDIVCPSDYMIQKMLDNDMLAEINFDNIPNIKNIDENYMIQSREFDPENKYSVPYCVGTVGILYNKTMVEEPVDSWDILWNEKYADNMLMFSNSRDAFALSLLDLGYDFNTTDQMEIEEAALKKEEDELSKARLSELQKELAEERDMFNAKKAQWENEKNDIGKVQHLLIDCKTEMSCDDAGKEDKCNSE